MAAHRSARRASLAKHPRRFQAGVAGLAAIATVVALTGVASAFWTSAGSSSATGTTGTLNAPTAVAGAQTPGTGTVHVTWTASTGTPSPTSYKVYRNDVSAAVCTSAGTSCDDTSVPLGNYTYTVVAIFKSWTATSAPSATVNVVQAPQSITFGAAPTGAVYGGSGTVSATSTGSGNPVVFTSDTPAVCTVTGTAVTYDHAGTCVVNANKAATTYYSAAPQQQQTIVIDKAAQSVLINSTAPTNATVGGSGYQPTATSTGSGNAVVFSIDPSTALNCSISAGVVSYLKAGTCTIDADKAGTADYYPAADQQSFQISKAAQAVNITSTAPADAKVTDTYTITATTTGGSGNPIVFSIDPLSSSVCSIVGSVVTFNAAGTCRVNADQAGNDDYLPAAQVYQDIVVTKKAQAITFGTAPSGAVFLGPNVTVTATGGASGNAVTFTSATPTICTVTAGGSVTLGGGAGTCTINADQAGNTVYAAAPQQQQSFPVAKAMPTVTFTSVSPGSSNVGTTYTPTATVAPSGQGLTATIGVSGACSIASGVVTFGPSTGTCTITASSASNANFNAASASQNVTVNSGNTPPVFVSTYPTNGQPQFPGSNPFSAAPCGANRICATVTDNVSVATVTFTMTSDNGRCWNGSSFINGSCTAQSMSLVSGTSANGVWRSGGSVFSSMVNGNHTYTLTFVATDGAGASTTQVVTFTAQ